MLWAVITCSPADLLAHSGTGCASPGAVDDIAFRNAATAVVLVDVLGTHREGPVEEMSQRAAEE
jgi:hypothetical protein